MSNYTDKYLKYKKKYMNLKNISDYDKYGGGDLYNVIIFYDSTNPLVEKIFRTIKNDYKKYITNSNTNLNKPFYIDRDTITTNINLLLNIFFYKFCTDTIQPLLVFNFDDFTLSNRFTPYRPAFDKALTKYTDASTLKFNESSNLIINKTQTCDTLRLNCDKILKFINENINSESRKDTLATLLQIVKIYQDKAGQTLISDHTDRIGMYIDHFGLDNNMQKINIQNIIPPSGLIKNSIIIKNTKDTTTDKTTYKKILPSLKAYTNGTVTTLNNLLLDITNIEFNKVTEMIYLKKVSNTKFEVINIFEPLENVTTTSNSQDNDQD
jgi:hypothetical protein